jgi:hypothetical protein
MGMLQPTVAQIREDHLDFILDYFLRDAPGRGETPVSSVELAPFDLNTEADWALSADERAGPYAARFPESFFRQFPEPVAGPPGAPDPRRLREAVGEALEERALMEWGWDAWKERAAFEVIRACCAHAAGGGTEFTALAEDANYQSNGDCWRFLNEVGSGREGESVAAVVRRLMLDRSYADESFLYEVQSAAHFLALLRPREVGLVRAAVPRLERFYAAVPRSESLFREALRALIDYVASVGDEGVCLICWSTTT